MNIASLLLLPSCLASAAALAQAPAPAQPSAAGIAARQQATPPEPLPDGRVTFTIRAPNARTVTLTGDYPLVRDYHGGRVETPLVKSEDGVWRVTVGPLRPDLYNYAFMVDGVRTLDPANVHINAGPSANRSASWLLVPGKQSDPYRTDAIPHGRVVELWYPSPSLGGHERRMFAYLPPDYDRNAKRYPVFYLFHGGGEDETSWQTLGRAPQILDHMLANREIVPMIVVMPNWNVGQRMAPVDDDVPQRFGGAPAPAEAFSKSVVADLIPFVDRSFRTIPDRWSRAVAGTSAGGMQAILTGLGHVDQFAWIGLLSPALARVPGAQISIPLPPDADRRRGPDLGVSIDPAKLQAYFPALSPTLNDRLGLLYLSVGGAEGLMEEELAGLRAFDEKGVKYTFVTRPDYGHEWAFWRLDLQEFGRQLFRRR